MMRRLIISLGFIGLLLFPASAFAFTAIPDSVCRNADTKSSAVCSDRSSGTGSNDPISGSGGIINKVANIITLFAGSAAIIVLIIAALTYVTAGGDSNKVGTAKRTVMYTLIGIAVLALARTILGFALGQFS